MKNKQLVLTVITLSLCLLVTACTGKNNLVPEPNVTDNEVVEEIPEVVEKPVVPAFGGTLKLTSRNPITLNPLLNEDRSVDQVLKLMFEPLFKIDAQYKPIPNLVETYAYDASNSSMTITLKSDLIFHNLEPLTTADVAYSIDVLKEAQITAIYKSCVDNIQRVSIIDDLNLKIYFKQPYAFSAYYMDFPILPKDYNTSADYDAFKPIGSGLYAFSDFTALKNIKLVAFENRKEEVYVQNIECTITRDEVVDADSFKQNLTNLLAPAKFDWFTHSDDNTQRTLSYTTNYVEFIGFNFNNTLLNNVKVRQAIAFGINREAIAEKQYLSHVVLTDTLVHPNSWLQSEEKPLTYIYNVDQSRSLLDTVPLADNDEDGFYDQTSNATANKITFKLLVNKDNVSRMKVAELLLQDFTAIGLTLEIDAVDKTTFLTKLDAGEYDLVLSGWKLSAVPDFTDFFHSQKIIGGSNFIHYNNPLMDKALENVFTSLNDDSLKANVQKLNELYTSELPYFSLYFMNSIILTHNDIYGELEPTTDHVLSGIENLYISK